MEDLNKILIVGKNHRFKRMNVIFLGDLKDVLSEVAQKELYNTFTKKYKNRFKILDNAKIHIECVELNPKPKKVIIKNL